MIWFLVAFVVLAYLMVLLDRKDPRHPGGY